MLGSQTSLLSLASLTPDTRQAAAILLAAIQRFDVCENENFVIDT